MGNPRNKLRKIVKQLENIADKTDTPVSCPTSKPPVSIFIHVVCKRGKEKLKYVYWLFDSHSRKERGLPFAHFLKFKDRDNLIKYLSQLFDSDRGKIGPQFIDVTPLQRMFLSVKLTRKVVFLSVRDTISVEEREKILEKSATEVAKEFEKVFLAAPWKCVMGCGDVDSDKIICPKCKTGRNPEFTVCFSLCF